MCYDEQPYPEGVRMEIDPTVALLVRYAEQFGRTDSELGFRRNRERDALDKLACTEKELQNTRYYLERQEARSRDLENYATKLERKIPKKKPVKKAKGKK